jgi:hypothetical protein
MDTMPDGGSLKRQPENKHQTGRLKTSLYVEINISPRIGLHFCRNSPIRRGCWPDGFPFESAAASLLKL